MCYLLRSNGSRAMNNDYERLQWFAQGCRDRGMHWYVCKYDCEQGQRRTEKMRPKISWHRDHHYCKHLGNGYIVGVNLRSYSDFF